MMSMIVAVVVFMVMGSMFMQIVKADEKETLDEAVVERAAKLSKALAQLDKKEVN